MVKRVCIRPGTYGYTLVELLVVIGIIAMVATMAIVGTRNSTNDAKLQAASRLFVADLRNAQNRALNGADGQNYNALTINTCTAPMAGGPANCQYTISTKISPYDSYTRVLDPNISVSATDGNNIEISGSYNVYVNFAHPAVSSRTGSLCPPTPGPCTDSSISFTCKQESLNPTNCVSYPTPLTVKFFIGSQSRSVEISGSGYGATRIYEK